MLAQPLVSLQTKASPSRDQFRTLAESYNVVPVYCEIIADTETPVTALAKLGKGNCAWLLESVDGGETLGRYSFLGNSAYQTFTARASVVTIETNGKQETFHAADPLQTLHELLQSYRVAPVPGLPTFAGGAVGYVAYDAVRYCERLECDKADPLNLPDLCFLFTDIVLVFDHVSRRLKVVANARISADPDRDYDRAVAALTHCLSQLQSTPEQPTWFADTVVSAPEFTSTYTKPQFMAAVDRCKEYIAAGDAFQIVLSQRLSTPIAAHPFRIYRALRTLNPSPYMYYLELPGVHIAGSSPEVLVKVEGNNVTLRPIAGTRKRGLSKEDDARLSADLLADDKERAEHVMLVDLGRNDLGRVCEVGSVQVDALLTVERYSHVIHLVSQVSGQLAAGKTPFDVLRATFPAGTVSGAPKVRAMQIIDELEPVRRGPYAGGIGYFGYNGQMDTCITIRTVVVKDRIAHVQAGAGIVADSDAEREYEETLAKAQAVLKAIQVAEVKAS